MLSKSGPWADLGLTLPVFVGYHLAVVFLPFRNAADVVTRELVSLAHNDLIAYSGLTLAIGGAFVGVLIALGRGHTLRWSSFAWIAAEGLVYAIAMRLVAGYVVGKLALTTAALSDRAAGVVMAMGAGFYEEIAFRVGLYGLGSRLLSLLLFRQEDPVKGTLLKLVWAVVAAAVFSGWHHLGAGADPLDLRVFIFRWVCGLVFTLIYAFRGFAPVVWTHMLYDVWVMAL